MQVINAEILVIPSGPLTTTSRSQKVLTQYNGHWSRANFCPSPQKDPVAMNRDSCGRKNVVLIFPFLPVLLFLFFKSVTITSTKQKSAFFFHLCTAELFCLRTRTHTHTHKNTCKHWHLVELSSWAADNIENISASYRCYICYLTLILNWYESYFF